MRPGNASELAEAIQRLAADAQLRIELGRSAREAALAHHTWRQNARRVLAYYEDSRCAPNESALRTTVAAGPSPSRNTNLAKQNL